jgi:hypothetical protein
MPPTWIQEGWCTYLRGYVEQRWGYEDGIS